MLETARLVLKPHTMSNLEKMNKWRNDRELLYYDDDGPELLSDVPVERTRRYLEFITKPNQVADIIRFGIHKKQDDSLIGFCMIAFIDDFNRSCKFGITIGEKSEWGKGLGKEVLREVIRYCFEDLNMNRIGAEVFSYNKRSIAMFEGAGFKREGTIRQCVFKRGRFEDEHIYGLIREEWKK